MHTAVSSSEASSARLKAAGIRVVDLNEVTQLHLYIDGADEATPARQLIKGGGAALTREKIIAAAARRFVCIVDETKLVKTLGTFPLPIEVIPMARAYVARQLLARGGRPVWREGLTTDNGNHILDVHGLSIPDPRGTRGRPQPDRRGRDRRSLCSASGGRAAGRHRAGRADPLVPAPRTP